ncbi:MAG: beta-ketoacyl-ACP synthase II [Chloroherpetonaceae bacterium]|nr:beta-ketoacyl-ACP synthase II [Chloroherpetonaceae bacterium]MDW8437356.1 beta-ketoacyl-ACP synthase II [Chloroherpetonaceae bacterium]
MREKKRIVVSGMGVITPIGIGNDAYWQALSTGKSGAAPITLFDTTGYETRFACEVKDFDVTQFIDKKSSLRMDRFCQFGVAAGEMALKDANITKDNSDLRRVGVVFGSGIGGMHIYDAQFRTLVEKSPDRVSPFFIPMMISNIAAGYISIRNGLQGANYGTVSACATSLHAIIDAYMILQLGYADAMVCGGSEASITPMGIAGFNAMKAMSTRNDSPETASRPYDRDRDGFVMGEGAGALVIEPYENAVRRGAKIYAEIAGVGMSADAYHLSAPHPEGDAVVAAMKMAMDDAGISPYDIQYINAHGTSTPLGDVAELKAIKKCFGDAVKNINISATKSMTGHLLGAAGVIESIACVLAIQHQTVPPTINIENLDPEVDLNVTPNHAVKRDIHYALNNGFGFGGHNATVIFKKV